MDKIAGLLPLQFRILYRQFLLRVVDLEALSIEADVPRFLGQFASLLILFSVARTLGLMMANPSLTSTPEAYLSFAWKNEQSLISMTMLVVGLVAVVSWDSTFPDRRDVMILSPLSVTPRTILIAKVAASASLLGLAVLTANVATGIAWPLELGAHHDSMWGFLQAFAAYWLTMTAASVFMFCSALAVQGLTALLLPRWVFLRLSALLQLVAFGTVLGVYFLQPSIATPAAMAAPNNQWVAWSPSFWFFAMFNQLNGSLPPRIAWLAARAWTGLGIAVSGATTSLVVCYLRTMKKTVEEPDLVPGARGAHWAPQFGSPLRTAIVLFSVRSLMRSRQHRLAFAFYLAVIVLIAMPWLWAELSSATLRPVNAAFLISTFMMMSFAVFGIRRVFSLPISLPANWVLRITEMNPPEKYVSATRQALLLLAVVPIWLVSLLLSFSFRPWQHVAIHLTVLALMGWIFAELSLIGFYKVPFTCSYLPGKMHVQVVFWYFLALLITLAMLSAEYELPSLNDPFRCACMLSILCAAGLGLWIFNRHRARSAALSFEELPPKEILTLGLIPGRSAT